MDLIKAMKNINIFTGQIQLNKINIKLFVYMNAQMNKILIKYKYIVVIILILLNVQSRKNLMNLQRYILINELSEY